MFNSCNFYILNSYKFIILILTPTNISPFVFNPGWIFFGTKNKNCKMVGDKNS